MTECRSSLEDFPGRESFGMNREECDFLGSNAKAGIGMVEERVLNTNFSRSAQYVGNSILDYFTFGISAGKMSVFAALFISNSDGLRGSDETILVLTFFSGSRFFSSVSGLSASFLGSF